MINTSKSQQPPKGVDDPIVTAVKGIVAQLYSATPDRMKAILIKVLIQNEYNYVIEREHGEVRIRTLVTALKTEHARWTQKHSPQACTVCPLIIETTTNETDPYDATDLLR